MKLDVASPTERAWAAGFFDGEGTTGITSYTGGKSKSAYVTISQVDRQPLERFKAAVGGLGEVRGPYGPYSGNRQASYQFTTHVFANVQQILALMWDYMSDPKRKQASSTLATMSEYYSTKNKVQG